jgi:hypothetical protein
MADAPDRAASEDELRDVERVMMYIAEAQRKADEMGRKLASEAAPERVVAALLTASAALRAEHNRLLNSTHFVVPGDPIPKFPANPDEDEASDQQRMAI